MQRFVNKQVLRKTSSMKLKSVSKFLALVVVMLAPLYMSGKKISNDNPRLGAYHFLFAQILQTQICHCCFGPLL